MDCYISQSWYGTAPLQFLDCGQHVKLFQGVLIILTVQVQIFPECLVLSRYLVKVKRHVRQLRRLAEQDLASTAQPRMLLLRLLMRKRWQHS